MRWAARYRDRGVVGVGLGGLEAEYSARAVRAGVRAGARAGAARPCPHAGEVAGPASIRGALDALGADRLRHGIRAVEDPTLVDELRDRELVLDVCPISNVRTGAVRSLEEHPLPRLVTAGVHCSVSDGRPGHVRHRPRLATTRRPAGSASSPRAAYEAGLLGALCDEATLAQLRAIGDAFDWRDAS